MRQLDVITTVLLVVGGLNWGLVGVFDWNLVYALFGEGTFLSRLTYILVGVSALYQAFAWRGMHARWYKRREEEEHIKSKAA